MKIINSNMDDRELLLAYVKLESEMAFAILEDRYRKSVYLACLKRLEDAHVAEDTVQLVFIELHKQAKSLSLNPEVKIAGWLSKTAKNKARNAARIEAPRRLMETPLNDASC